MWDRYEKEWTHSLCLNPRLRIPATIAVPRMWIERDIMENGNTKKTAQKALKMLQMVRDKQNQMGMCPAKKIVHGVSKLGYSWEALDVKMWKEDQPPNAGSSAYKLHSSLYELTQHIDITDNLVGQAHVLDHVLVQEFIPHVFELRLYFIENECKFEMFTRFDKVKPNHEFGEFNYLQRKDVLDLMGDDKEALEAGIELAKTTGRELLDWLRIESLEDIIPAIRFDFFVGYDPTGLGGVDVLGGTLAAAANGSAKGPSPTKTPNTAKGNGSATSATSQPGSSSSSKGAAGQAGAPPRGSVDGYKVLGNYNGPTASSSSSSTTGATSASTACSTIATTPEEALAAAKKLVGTTYSNQWRSPKTGALVSVNTLEMCELGFSILHNKAIPKAVMPAVVRSCLRLDRV
ncbi:unnamed protein product [Amoebophrya sp. A25]|nr:unnamed protein product [Amoebophrya sp. A25]|eukprot:GSA25T00008609001.1